MQESRCLAKCRKAGLDCPVLYHVDNNACRFNSLSFSISLSILIYLFPAPFRLVMEWIEGETVNNYLQSLDLSDQKGLYNIYIYISSLVLF